MIQSKTALFGLILFCHTLDAAEVSSVSLFASNNTGVIQPRQAYDRMLSAEQSQLKNTIIAILQSHHLEQSQFEDSLGMYQMAGDGRLTSDNGEIFTTSPYQPISDQLIFSMSQQIATALEQESVAVFIPDEQAGAADIIVDLATHHDNLPDTIKRIHDQLPADYAQAFTVHFDSRNGGYNQATIASIEWLGNHIDPAVIQSAFPGDKITIKHGNAFLVFKDGKIVNF